MNQLSDRIREISCATCHNFAWVASMGEPVRGKDGALHHPACSVIVGSRTPPPAFVGVAQLRPKTLGGPRR